MSSGSCSLLRAREPQPGHGYDGKQAVQFLSGISRESVGAQRLCLHRVVIPAGSRGEPHLHRDHESAIYVISGEHEVWCGQDLSERIWLEPGDFLYIPPDVPHVPVNRGDTDVVAIVARSDASEQESVELLGWPSELSALASAYPPHKG